MSVSSTPPLSGGSGTFSVATWNIRSARGAGLTAAAKGLRQMGVGCCILTETKLTHDRYPKSASGYRVISSKAASPQQGGVALLWARRLRRDHAITRCRLRVSIVGQLCFCQNAAADSHLAQALCCSRQSCSPCAPNIPGSDGEGPATPRQRGRR